MFTTLLDPVFSALSMIKELDLLMARYFAEVLFYFVLFVILIVLLIWIR